jgi:ribosomal protein S18 acetylase RimI-like enzyme
VSIRKATERDIPAMARMLARAFHEDPVVEWVFRDAGTRPRYAERFFTGRARVLIGQREIYTLDGTPAAAMWARPDEWRDPPLQAIKELAVLAPGVGRRIFQTMRGLVQIEARHPKPPHWYLAVLGTHPERQGEGLATALLEPVLEGCDRDEVTLPNGPPMWLMWREPRL